MPRYHFHQHDGRDVLDHDGAELPDLAAARNAAARAFIEMVRDHVDELWRDGGWSMTVTDETGLALFSLDLSISEAPAGKRVQLAAGSAAADPPTALHRPPGS